MPPDDPRNPLGAPDQLADLSTGAPSTDFEGADSLINLLAGVARDRPAQPPVGPNGFPPVPGYEIKSELGRGGMGVVYHARHLALDRPVALKMILTADAPSAGQIARFRDEAAAVAAVRHPNVIQVFELCPQDCERPYFTMEFVAGGSLAKSLKANGPLAPTVTAELLAAVADGLQAAHDAGIVHRDVKPANILLAKAEGVRKGSPPSRSEWQPKVSDFGLAKRLAFDLTRTQDLRGTPAYMAPEQAGGGGYVGPGADVYALGAVLFECLTGRLPFIGENTAAVIHAVLNTPAPSPRGFAPALPRDVELICLKCLEKRPEHRYPTAAALATDLRNFVAGRPVSVRPIGAVSRVTRWVRRRPTAAALVVLSAALLLGVPPLAAWALGQIDASAAKANAAHQAKQLAELAKELEEEKHELAQKDRDAALGRARKGELLALQNALRTRASNQPLSWSGANLAELGRAVELASGSPTALDELRSVASVGLLAADLEPLPLVEQEFSAHSAATDPKTGRVAFGKHIAWTPNWLYVRILDPVTGRTERELKFTAGFVPDPKSVVGRPDSVHSLAFSPDGTRLFVGTRSSQVIRFDLDRPGSAEVARWSAAKSAVERLAVSPDGKTVYGLCGSEKPVFVWDAATGKRLAKLEPSEAPITDFVVLGTGELITCDARELCRWTAHHKLVQTAPSWTAQHKPVQTVPSDGVARLAVTPCGTLLAGNRRNFDIYDPVALVQLDRVVTAELRRGVHEDYVRTIAVHPSGAFVVTSSGDTDRTIRVWELASCRLVGTVVVKGSGPIALAWSGDGSALFATGDKRVARWKFRPPAAQQFVCPGAGPVTAVTFAPDGRVAALVDAFDNHRELRVGTPSTRAGVVRFAVLGGNGRPGVAFAPEGWLAVTAPQPGVIRWEPATPVSAPGFVKDITWCPRFGPNNADRPRPLWAVVDSSNVYSFDANNQVRTTWSNAVEGVTLGLASLDALAVGRTVVAAGGRSGSVHLLDAEKGQSIGVVANSGDAVLSLAIEPNDALVLAGTQSGKVRLIRVSNRQELPALAAHPDAVTAVALNRAGTLLATGSRDRTVRLWKRVGERFESLFTVSALAGPVRELQFHPSEDRLLVLVAQERAARVWDIEKLKSQLERYRLAW